MQSGGQKRTRSERVAAVELPPKFWGRILDTLRRGDVLARIGLCLLAALAMWVATRGWAPPFAYREDQILRRNVAARVVFSVPNLVATRDAREKARRQARYVYVNDPAPLVQLRERLQRRVVELTSAETKVADAAGFWQEFLPRTDDAGGDEPAVVVPTESEQQEMLEAFRTALAEESRLEEFRSQVAAAMAPYEARGLLSNLKHPIDQGNQAEIFIYPLGDATGRQRAAVGEVRIEEVIPKLRADLEKQLGTFELAERVFTWIKRELPGATTLSWDKKKTKQVIDQAVAEVVPKVKIYQIGDVLAEAKDPSGSPLPISHQSLELLLAEHNETIQQISFAGTALRSAATLGMFMALYTLCGFYIHFRNVRALESVGRLAGLLALVVATVAISFWIHPWRAEVIPLLLLGMTVSIVYHQELALLLSAAVGMIVVFSVGAGLAEFVILMAACATGVFLVSRIRSRSKLIYVGLTAGLVAMLTTVGVSIVDGHPMGWQLLADAGRFGLMAVVAGFLMTGLLPFVETTFGVLTDISLLELGDVAHPLLQELVRRAPGTYNHSINVASIAEAAAERIGAHGLLVRVGAYFHDIGKMLKPGYFVENQGQEANRHESLMPAMSTLIIIAHVKDGANLARQHHLPTPIIDFIEQHHGTTLVEFFYQRANEQQQDDPDAAEVDESTYRYPGPKPQSKEAGILMLADTVESASRVLVEPTPARIESLVHDLVMKRLLSGELDDSALSLQEVRVIEESLVKSLIAVYHGRVKYPEQPQKTA